ncbi:hypothetical protein [Pseudomonas sp. D(2018)]|uniref:hypothetical protein n=1 Tax=Pseudomonas sp. D(2018) TaxID=2502238 RepID=UPI0010F7A276|nr:hypothetical protein [Pseudomonas sp. D(2018)]
MQFDECRSHANRFTGLHRRHQDVARSRAWLRISALRAYLALSGSAMAIFFNIDHGAPLLEELWLATAGPSSLFHGVGDDGFGDFDLSGAGRVHQHLPLLASADALAKLNELIGLVRTKLHGVPDHWL